jgi:hypothetical protein
MKKRILLAAGAWVLGVGVAAHPAVALDLTVANVEVTQGVQTPANTIPLVARRSTAVRATLGVADSAGAVRATGRLHVFVNGTAITPAAGLLPINDPFFARLSPDREVEIDTLNFELPAPTAIPASTDVDFRVDVTAVTQQETDTGNNSGWAENLRFFNRNAPHIFYIPIDYTPSGLGLPPETPIAPGVGDALLRAILPVNDADPLLYRAAPAPPLTFSEDENGNGLLDRGEERNSFFSMLASTRQLIVENGVGANDRTFLYGWLAGSPFNGYSGVARQNARLAFGNTSPDRYQGTFAHEIGHLFGLEHPDDAVPPGPEQIDEVGWDVGGRLLDNPVDNNIIRRVRPTTAFDMMDGGELTRDRWLHTRYYTELFNHPTLVPDPLAEFKQFALWVAGVIKERASELDRLWPVFRYPWPSQPTLRARTRQPPSFAVQVRTLDGNLITVPFDAHIAGDGEKEQQSFGFFEVLVPYEGEVSAVRITDSTGRKVFGGLDRSRVPPRLRILAPGRGGKLTGMSRVTWQVEDSDTPASALMYQVAYSPDNGRSFVPVGVNLTRPDWTFDATRIPRSQGAGLIRVFVSDGLNTAFADVTGLSTP